MVSRSFSSVGFVGLGNMGHPMAKRLEDQFQVIVHDVNSENLKGHPKKAENIKNLCEQSEVIITMLPNGKVVNDVYCGEDGLLANAASGTCFIDCSTIEFEMAKYIHAKSLSSGYKMLDAPVSGGVQAARLGNLTFMIGGEKTTFETFRSIFKPMGSKLIYCGDSGNGQIAKICNNLLLAITMGGLCEAFHVGKRLGLNPKTLDEVINSSSGKCWSSELYTPCPEVNSEAPSSRNYKPGFMTSLLCKDLRLASEASKRAEFELKFGALALEIYESLSKIEDYASLDFTCLYKHMENK